MKQDYKQDFKKRYHHLDAYEREKIRDGITLEKTYSQIALEMNRNISTISREIGRNANSKKQYSSVLSQKRYEQRMKESHVRERLKNEVLRGYIISKLKIGWSPQIIAGRIFIDLRIKTNYESIYQWIYSEKRNLIKYLTRIHKIRLNRSLNNKKRSNIPNRVDISQRAESVLAKEEMGHYEADTVVGLRGESSLCVIQERKTRFCFITKLDKTNSENMHNALVLSLRRFNKHLVKTITLPSVRRKRDNGSENALHEKTNEILGTKSYFCRPYCSCDKGSIENLNGLIRRYLPKKTNFNLIEQQHLYTIQYQLNNRPRKCLNFKTPAELFILEEDFALTH